jgi:stringent starvation protein B
MRVSRRPYLLRAMHQWMTDSGLTPHVLVDAGVTGVDVPKEFVREGRIVLNVG